MSLVLFVGEGPRDEAILPALVHSLYPCVFTASFVPWNRLRMNAGRFGAGYERKLRFATRRARDALAVGLVAVVDGDRQPAERRKQLQEGRDADRESSPALPTALGVAVPHVEAWLLDDPSAVRVALGLPSGAPLPDVRQVENPKAALHRICAAANASIAYDAASRFDALRAVAARLQLKRCLHADHTGLSAFNEDISAELVPVLTAIE